MGIASMIIGIVALVLALIPPLNLLVFLPALVGLGLGIADLAAKAKSGQPRGMAIAGVILNPLAAIIIFLFYFLIVYGAATLLGPATSAVGRAFQQGVQQAQIKAPSVPVEPAPPMQPMKPVPKEPAAPPQPPPPAR
jgi:hypothetical protein